MAKWENLKSAVAAVVKTNGNKEITGANMQTVLNSIINAVGNNAGFAGIATPTTNPCGIPDGPTFYIATQGGTYSYFPTDGQGTPATIQDGVISVLYNQGNGLWSVTTTPMNIADCSVTTAKLANGVITTAKLANGSVTNDKIADGTIDGYLKIAENSIRWENMDQGSVGKDTLQDDAVIESKIKDGAVTEYKLGTSSVSTRSIKDGAVTTNKLYNGTVTGAKIADGAVGTDKIADGAITGEKIANGTIDNEKIADSGIRTENLENECVTTEKLAPFAVDTGNIENGAVTKGKLDEDVVSVLDEVDNKANIDGFYDTMGVGTARNLLGKTSVVDTFFRKIIGVGVAKGNAYIDGVRGNSVAWGQIVMFGNSQYYRDFNPTYCQGVESNNVYNLTINAQEHPSTRLQFSHQERINVGHKYYMRAYINPQRTTYSNFYLSNFSQIIECVANQWTCVSVIMLAQSNIDCGFYFNRQQTLQEGDVVQVKNINFIDLTFLGIDNLTTTEEVEIWLAAHSGEADYYAYDAGSLLSVKMQNVKTVGFNQWDEQWESGNINTGSGQNIPDSATIRSKNYTKIIPNAQYYFKGNSVQHHAFFRLYDAAYNYIGYDNVGAVASETIFTFPANAAYFRFVCDGTTYNHNICINFSNSGLNGTYMPYQTKTKALPITTLTGNHLGTRSTIFHDGMRGVGNGYDEISGNSAIVRIASVKVSDLEWVDVENNVFVANIPTRKYGNGIIVMCDKYASQARGVDKGIYAHTITDSVLVTDTAYQSVAAFKTAMGDATILFELAEPIEYTDLMDEQENDFSLPIGIEVEPLGTLETLPQNTEGEELTMCAPTLSMQFSIDAAKILTDELPNEYRTNVDDKANWNKFLAIVNEKLGGAMGGTISVDDEAVGHGLDFTFAAAQAENNRDVEPIEE